MRQNFKENYCEPGILRYKPFNLVSNAKKYIFNFLWSHFFINYYSWKVNKFHGIGSVRAQKEGGGGGTY